MSTLIVIYYRILIIHSYIHFLTHVNSNYAIQPFGRYVILLLINLKSYTLIKELLMFTW